MRTAFSQAKAQQQGKQFEELFDRAAFRHGVFSLVFPSGVKWVGKKMIPVKTPFDRILTMPEGRVTFVDTKSFGTGKSLRAVMLVEHQVMALHRLWQDGFVSGYVVWHREPNLVVFYTAEQLFALLRYGEPIQATSGLQLGSFMDVNPRIIFDTHLPA